MISRVSAEGTHVLNHNETISMETVRVRGQTVKELRAYKSGLEKA